MRYSILIFTISILIGFSSCEKNQLSDIELEQNKYEEYKSVPCLSGIQVDGDTTSSGCDLILIFEINPELNIHQSNIGYYQVEVNGATYQRIESNIFIAGACTPSNVARLYRIKVQLYDREGLKAGDPYEYEYTSPII